MPLARAGWRLLGVLALVACNAVGACDSGGTECTCAPAGLTVNIPSQLANELISLTPSGLACDGAVVTPKPGPHVSATQYHVAPTQSGPCQLDLLFTDGTAFSDDLTVIETTGCCAALRTEPPGAADIDVPPPTDATVGDAE